MGSAHLVLRGTTPCTLTGYAGLDVTTSNGETLHALRGGANMNAPETPEGTVTLTAGRPAVITFGWNQGCGLTSTPTVTGVTLTPPGLHQGTRFTGPDGPVGSPLCTPPNVNYVTGTRASG